MNLPLFIAKRYLIAKKSHNVINIISAISVAGLAIGTSVLIIILSVYNGFDELIKESVSDFNPDILVVPAKGKSFVPDNDVFDALGDYPQVYDICDIIQEEVFISYNGHQGVAKAIGVGEDHIFSTRFKLRSGDIKYCAVGVTLASDMGINPNFVSPLEIYYPERGKNISLINPSTSLKKVNVFPSSTLSVTSDTDESVIIVPIESLRELLGYDEELSGIEIRLCEGSTKKDVRKLTGMLEDSLGEEFKILDRYMQNESLYKMMRYEKASIFLILLFIIIVIAFNIFGSLSMLIIEKKDDVETLKSMGAPRKLIKHIFVLEGWLISLLGMIIGMIIGLAVAFLQQKYGFVSLPGNYMISAYPVAIKWTDILITVIGVSLIGYIIALLPASKLNGTDS